MLYNILNRIGFGPNHQSLKRLQKLGLEAYIEEQLSPSSTVAPIVQQKKAAFKFKDMPNANNKGFQYIHASLEELWKLTKSDKTLEQKGQIPAAEVAMNSCINAIYSPWQLRELLVHFWHNHFNVSIEANERIALTLPLYDRDVIRVHCLGNFRAFLEAVAKSQAMLFYLNNASNRASPANENFARELFELHTLGASNYWNHLYNKWREVPGALEGSAEGYIDEDIYEAARAFTGWTVADGQWTEEGEKPNTGAFLYLETWHDNYQKRILGHELESNQAALADGQKVLDLLAYHKGTARFICTKLCKKFIADQPPSSIIEKATQVWIAHQKSEDQIKQVVRTILLSDEFKQTLGQKLKNPFELSISMIRVLDLDFNPNMNLYWLLKQMGYHLFSWSTPTGHPDQASYWLNSSMLLKRWNFMPAILFDNWHQMFAFDADQLLPSTSLSSQEIVQFLVEKILGEQHTFSAEQQQKLVQILLVEGRTAQQPPRTYGKEDKNYRFAHVISLILMSPNFQYR